VGAVLGGRVNFIPDQHYGVLDCRYKPSKWITNAEFIWSKSHMRVEGVVSFPCFGFSDADFDKT
jgi:hypothetical protein